MTMKAPERKQARKARCSVCEREAGTLNDRCDWPPLPGEDAAPLGKLSRCKLCKRRVCPDCLHEADCCFDDHKMNQHFGPCWAPPGWRWIHDGLYVRKS